MIKIMIYTFIKYFFVNMFTIYIYCRLLNLTANRFRFNFPCFSFAINISIIIAFLSRIEIHISLPLSFLSLLVFITLYFKIHFRLSIITYLIAYTFNYSIAAFSYLLSVFAFYNLNKKNHTILLFILGAIIEFIILTAIFRTRRLSKGMPFLLNQFSNNTGILISIFTLLCSLLLNNAGKTDFQYIPLSILLIFSSAAIIIWWKFHLKKLYLDHLKDSEIHRLKEELEQKEQLISYLRRNNSELAAIIHKDNKLIPAMELAVKELLTPNIREGMDKNFFNLSNAEDILKNLEHLSLERTNIMHTYDTTYKTFPSTGIASTDSIISYMAKKAMYCNIQFDVTVSEQIEQIIKNTLKSEDLNTLLADFIDNAIIATKNVPQGRILIHLGSTNGYFQINCFDNGIPFQTKTLLNLGKIPSSTYLNEGGSGIGYMTIFSIKQSYHATLIIKRFTDNELFTKNIILLFDGLNQYTIE